MKSFSKILILCGLVVYSMAMMTEEETQAFQVMMLDCAAKEKATKDDLDELIAQKLPTSPTAKCLRACLCEAMGIIKDNKLDIGMTLGFEVEMADVHIDEDLATERRMLLEIARECAKLTHTDRCEFGAKITSCIQELALAKGVIFDLHNVKDS